jgi:Ca2+-binding EF-hand superfamily protein
MDPQQAEVKLHDLIKKLYKTAEKRTDLISGDNRKDFARTAHVSIPPAATDYINQNKLREKQQARQASTASNSWYHALRGEDPIHGFKKCTEQHKIYHRNHVLLLLLKYMRTTANKSPLPDLSGALTLSSNFWAQDDNDLKKSTEGSVVQVIKNLAFRVDELTAGSGVAQAPDVKAGEKSEDELKRQRQAEEKLAMDDNYMKLVFLDALYTDVVMQHEQRLCDSRLHSMERTKRRVSVVFQERRRVYSGLEKALSEIREIFRGKSETQITSMFRMYDADDSKSLDNKEFYYICKYAHVDQTNSQQGKRVLNEQLCERMFQAVDLNSDGTVSQDEFKRWVKAEGVYQYTSEMDLLPEDEEENAGNFDPQHFVKNFLQSVGNLDSFMESTDERENQNISENKRREKNQIGNFSLSLSAASRRQSQALRSSQADRARGVQGKME